MTPKSAFLGSLPRSGRWTVGADKRFRSSALVSMVLDGKKLAHQKVVTNPAP
jgi:hypothetical protein